MYIIEKGLFFVDIIYTEKYFNYVRKNDKNLK